MEYKVMVSAPMYAALLERCRRAQSLPDFPQMDLGQFFSTSDTDDRAPPVQELIDFVRTAFDVEALHSRERLEALPGALSLVEEALRDLACLHPPVEHAQLLAYRGQLLQGVHKDPQKARAALEAFKAAVARLPAEGPSSTLRRHCAWRAANLGVELGDEENAATLLQAALEGPVQYATYRLYFQCATRLLRLTPNRVHRVLHAIQDDLRRAWVRLPAKHMLQGIPAGSHQPQRLEPLAEEPAISTELATATFVDGRSEWDPRDRLSVCILLLYVVKEPLKAEVYQKEAHALMSCLRRVRDDPHLDVLRCALENAPCVS